MEDYFDITYDNERLEKISIEDVYKHLENPEISKEAMQKWKKFIGKYQPGDKIYISATSTRDFDIGYGWSYVKLVKNGRVSCRFLIAVS